MTQAILITAYQDPANLLSLLDYFGPDFLICIHVDRRVAPLWRREGIWRKLLNYPAVVNLSDRYAVHWGGIKHLYAVLAMAEKAIANPHCSYVHLITGQDYPLRPRDQLLAFSGNAEAMGYLHNVPLPAPPPMWEREDGGLDRVRFFHLYDTFDIGRSSQLNRRFMNWQRRLRFRRPLQSWMPRLHGGSPYWSLSSTLVRYVVALTREQPALLRRFRHCFCAEELYLQTLLMNSPYAAQINGDNLRYVDWSGRDGRPLPAFLDQRDVNPALSSKALFARKIDSRHSLGFTQAVQRSWQEAG